MKRVKLAGLLVLVVLLLMLVWQNRAPVQTKILFMSVSMPAALLVFLTGAIGFLSGILTSLLLSRKPHRAPAREELQGAGQSAPASKKDEAG